MCLGSENLIWDRLLNTGRRGGGGATKPECWGVGDGKSFTPAEGGRGGGGLQRFGVILTQELEVLGILKREHKRFLLFSIV